MKNQHIVYKTNGKVCADEIEFDIINGVLHNVEFHGGCAGNTRGLAALAEGMRAEDIVVRLAGTDCHGGESCPNELAKAVQKLL